MVTHEKIIAVVGHEPTVCGCVRIEKQGEAGYAFACQRCQYAWEAEYLRVREELLTDYWAVKFSPGGRRAVGYWVPPNPSGW